MTTKIEKNFKELVKELSKKQKKVLTKKLKQLKKESDKECNKEIELQRESGLTDFLGRDVGFEFGNGTERDIEEEQILRERLEDCEEKLEELQQEVRIVTDEAVEEMSKINNKNIKLVSSRDDLVDDITDLKTDLLAEGVDKEALREQINIKQLEIEKLNIQMKDKGLDSLFNVIREKNDYTEDNIKNIRDLINEDPKNEEELFKGQMGKLSVRFILDNTPKLEKKIMEFVNNKQIKKLSGELGEELMIEYFAGLISNEMNYNNNELKDIYIRDRDRKIKRLAEQGKKDKKKKKKKDKTATLKEIKLMGKLNGLSIKPKETGKMLLQRIHTHILSVDNREIYIKNILQPISTNAYEDLSWYFGKGDKDDVINEMLIDVKVIRGKTISGNLLSYKKAMDNYDRPLFYLKIHYGRKNGIIVVFKVEMINIRRFKFENFSVFGDGQFKHNNQENRTKMISAKRHLLACNIGAIEGIENKVIKPRFISYQGLLAKLTDNLKK